MRQWAFLGIQNQNAIYLCSKVSTVGKTTGSVTRDKKNIKKIIRRQ